MAGKPNAKPTQAEYGQKLAELAQFSGRAVAEFQQALGHGPNGRTWREIGNALSEWLRTRPKAQ